jgi:hypothetical protein
MLAQLSMVDGVDLAQNRARFLHAYEDGGRMISALRWDWSAQHIGRVRARAAQRVHRETFLYGARHLSDRMLKARMDYEGRKPIEVRIKRPITPDAVLTPCEYHVEKLQRKLEADFLHAVDPGRYPSTNQWDRGRDQAHREYANQARYCGFNEYGFEVHFKR